MTSANHAALESRWIDRALAERAGLRRVDALACGEIIGRKSGDYAGILIPYFSPGSNCGREYRSRHEQPDFECDSAGHLKARPEYFGPPGHCLCVWRDGLRSRQTTYRECK